MTEGHREIFDALVHGFYYALVLGSIAGIAEWSLKIAFMATAGAFVFTALLPAIYYFGSRSAGR